MRIYFIFRFIFFAEFTNSKPLWTFVTSGRTLNGILLLCLFAYIRIGCAAWVLAVVVGYRSCKALKRDIAVAVKYALAVARQQSRAPDAHVSSRQRCKTGYIKPDL